MVITKTDVYWNYGATFLKIASSVILLPLILKMLPTELVGIWSVFMTITAFSNLLDFGFNTSFARNVTYVFGGVRNLTVSGFEVISSIDTKVDFGLLKAVISAMRWFYIRMAAVLLLILSTIGTYYIHNVIKNYHGDKHEVYVAWVILCLINTYNLFSLYYDGLLQGKGLVKRDKQITIIGYLIYLVVASFLILNRFGIVAIVCAQSCSVISIRFLSHRAFFTAEIKAQLNASVMRQKNEVLKAIYPNALKVGLTSFGGFVIQRSSLLIGSLFLSLKEIASYGISMQLITVLSGLSTIYIGTYLPKIAHLRVSNSGMHIKNIVLKGVGILMLTFIVGGTALIVFAPWALSLVESRTELMPTYLLLLALILSFIQTNLMMAGNILLTKNEVPFFKASLISAFLIVLGLFVGFKYLHLGLFGMVAVQLVVTLSYQGWKWPLEVVKDLQIEVAEIFEKKA